MPDINYKIIDSEGEFQISAKDFEEGFSEAQNETNTKIRMKMADGSTKDVPLSEYQSARQNGARAFTYSTVAAKPKRQVRTTTGTAYTGKQQPKVQPKVQPTPQRQNPLPKPAWQQPHQGTAWQPLTHDEYVAPQAEETPQGIPFRQPTYANGGKTAATEHAKTMQEGRAWEAKGAVGEEARYQQYADTPNMTEKEQEQFVKNNPMAYADAAVNGTQLPLRTVHQQMAENNRILAEDIQQFGSAFDQTFDEQRRAQIEAAGQEYKDSWKADGFWETLFSAGASGNQGLQMQRIGDLNKKYDPEVFALKTALDELEQQTAGMDKNRRARLASALYERIKNKLIEEQRNPEALGFILNGIKDSTMMQLAMGSMRTDYQNMIAQLAKEKDYSEENLAQSVFRGALSFAMDMPLYELTGGMGAGTAAGLGWVKEKLMQKVLKDLIARGVEKKAAQRAATFVAERAADTWKNKAMMAAGATVKRGVQAGITFGAADFVKGGALQTVKPLTYKDEEGNTMFLADYVTQNNLSDEDTKALYAKAMAEQRSFGAITEAAWEEGRRGAVSGAATGFAAVPTTLIGYGQGWGKKLLGDLVGFETEVAGMTTADVVMAAQDGEATDWWDTFWQTEANLGVFKIKPTMSSIFTRREGGQRIADHHIFRNIKSNLADMSARGRIEQGMMFTKQELDHMKANRPNLVKVVGDLMQSASKLDKTFNGTDQLNMSDLKKELASFIADPNMTEVEKQKMLYRLTGKVMKTSDVDDIEIDGTTVRLLNEDKGVISEQTYATEYEATLAALDHRIDMETNRRKNIRLAALEHETDLNFETWLEADVAELKNKTKLTDEEKALIEVFDNLEAAKEAHATKAEDRTEEQQKLNDKLVNAFRAMAQKHATVDKQVREAICNEYSISGEQLDAAIAGHTTTEAEKLMKEQDKEDDRVGIIGIGKGKSRTTKEESIVRAYDNALKEATTKVYALNKRKGMLNEAATPDDAETASKPVTTESGEEIQPAQRESVKGGVLTALQNGTTKVPELHAIKLKTDQAAEILRRNGIAPMDDKTLNEKVSDESFNPEIRQACKDVLEGREAMKGADDAVSAFVEQMGNAEEQRLEMLQEVDAEMIGNGMVTRAMMTKPGTTTDKVQVYVKTALLRDEEGNIDLNPENLIKVVDEQGNEYTIMAGQLDPGTLMSEHYSDAVKRFKEQQKALMQQTIAAMNEGGEIDLANDRFATEDGKEIKIANPAPDEQGKIAVRIDGKDGSMTMDELKVARDRAVIMGMQAEEQAIANREAIEAEAAEKKAVAVAETAPVATAPEAPKTPSKLDRIPKDEKGEPLFHKANPVEAYDAMVEAFGDEKAAQTDIKAQMKAIEEEIKKTEKALPKAGLSFNERVEFNNNNKARIEELKQKLAAYKEILNTPKNRVQKLDAEKAERQKAVDAANTIAEKSVKKPVAKTEEEQKAEVKAAAEELTAKHETRAEAEDELRTLRSAIREQQEADNKRVLDIDDAMKAHVEGKAILTDEQIKALAEERAALQQNIRNASEALDTYYRIQKEAGKEYSKREWDAMTEEERRNSTLSSITNADELLKKAREIYAAYGLDHLFTDDVQTIEDLIARNLPNKSMRWEDKEVEGGKNRAGVRSHMGGKNATRGIGRDATSYPVNTFLADGEGGKTWDEIVHDIYESPENQLENGEHRWDTDEIGNALDELFRSIEKPSDLRTAGIRKAIDMAEDEVKRMEDEAQYMEAEKEEAYQRFNEIDKFLKEYVNDVDIKMSDDEMFRLSREREELAKKYGFEYAPDMVEKPFGGTIDDAPFSLTGDKNEHNRRVEKRGGLRRGDAEETLEAGIRNLLDTFGKDTRTEIRALSAEQLWNMLSDRNKAQFKGGFEEFRRNVNGFESGGKIYINAESKELPMWILAHEFTHLLRHSDDATPSKLREAKGKLWNQMVKYVRESMSEKEWQALMDDAYDTYSEQIKDLSKAEQEDYVTEEVIGNWAGDNIFRNAEGARDFLERVHQSGGDSLSLCERMLGFIRRVFDLAFRHTSKDNRQYLAFKQAKEIWETLYKAEAAKHRAEELKAQAGKKIEPDAEVRLSVSKDLDEEYPDWRNQERKKGGHNTQISGTTKTYKKIGEHLLAQGGGKETILDASSGLGLGTQALREMGYAVDDVEPFQSSDRTESKNGLLPATYDSYNKIDKQYDVVLSNAVLNVIPDDWRRDVLHQMAKAVKVGGKMIVNVRGRSEVAGIKNKIELDDQYELLIPKGKNERGQQTYAYQKFFSKEELRDYIQNELGANWDVEIGNEANTGTTSGTVAVATKKAEKDMSEEQKPADGEVSLENSDKTKSMIGRSLSSSEVDELVKETSGRAQTMPKVEYSPENWIAEFGEDATLDTPLGKVKLSNNQYTKEEQLKRKEEIGGIRPTLTDPDFIYEVSSKAKDGKETERESTYIFIKTFKGKNGKKQYFFKSVTNKVDGLEVNMSNHFDRLGRIKRDLEEGKLLWKYSEVTSDLSDSNQGLYNQVENSTESTMEGRVNPQSLGKGTENNPNNQIKDGKFSITPQKNAEYLSAVEKGDTKKAEEMVKEAAKAAMPETKVVDEKGEPLKVYHRTNATEFVNKKTGQKYDDLDWQERDYWQNEATDEEWNDTWEERDFNVFNADKARRSVEVPGFFFAPEEYEDEGYGKRRIGAYLNIKNPIVDPDFRAMGFDRGTTDTVMEEAMRHLESQGYDGIINTEDGKPYEYIAFKSEQIKSADPVTRDDAGNVIPLSERFNEKKEDIRFSVSVQKADPFYSNAAKAVEDIKQEKATAEQWLKMIEKAGGLKKGEDKWMGLSEWLKQQNALAMLGDRSKTLTRQEVMDFISKNAIKIEEVNYDETSDSFEDLKKEYDRIYREEGYDAAWDYLYEKYGEEASYAFDDLGGELVINETDTAASILNTNKAINSTRLDYTTEGLENKKEIALTVPTIDPYNESDDVHFGDAGEGRAVAWVRFGDAESISETDGHSSHVLVIDEIQSKRHQDGREKGYRSKEVIDAKNEFEKWNNKETRLVLEMQKKYGIAGWREKATADELQTIEETRTKKDEAFERFKDISGNIQKEYDAIYNEIKEKYPQYRYDSYMIDKIDPADRARLEEAKKKVDAYWNGVADAPFDKNWHELAMKRMLRYAAENGYDKVAWTTGAQQAERYGLGGVVDKITGSHDGENKYVDIYLKNGNTTDFTVSPDGTIIDSGYKGQKVADVVGKDIAEKIMSLPKEEPWIELEGNNLKVGGEGMKGFYDQMLPKFMQKYGKKWGAKVGEVELDLPNEADRKMWSVDVTDSMKESVMQGQPMFSISKQTKKIVNSPDEWKRQLAEKDPESLNEEGRAHMDIYSNKKLIEARRDIRDIAGAFNGQIGNASAGAFNYGGEVHGKADAEKAQDIGFNMSFALDKYRDALRDVMGNPAYITADRKRVFDEAIAEVDKAIKWYEEFGNGMHRRVGDHMDDGIRFSVSGNKKLYDNEADLNKYLDDAKTIKELGYRLMIALNCGFGNCRFKSFDDIRDELLSRIDNYKGDPIWQNESEALKLKESGNSRDLFVFRSYFTDEASDAIKIGASPKGGKAKVNDYFNGISDGLGSVMVDRKAARIVFEDSPRTLLKKYANRKMVATHDEYPGCIWDRETHTLYLPEKDGFFVFNVDEEGKVLGSGNPVGFPSRKYNTEKINNLLEEISLKPTGVYSVEGNSKPLPKNESDYDGIIHTIKVNPERRELRILGMDGNVGWLNYDENYNVTDSYANKFGFHNGENIVNGIAKGLGKYGIYANGVAYDIMNMKKADDIVISDKENNIRYSLSAQQKDTDNELLDEARRIAAENRAKRGNDVRLNTRDDKKYVDIFDEIKNKSIPLQSKNDKSFTNSYGEYREGLEDYGKRIKDILDGKEDISYTEDAVRLVSGEAEEVSRQVRRQSSESVRRRILTPLQRKQLQREYDAVQQELQHRNDERVRIKKEYNIADDGSISVKDYERLFNDLNTDEKQSALMKAVLAALKNRNGKLYVTDDVSEEARGTFKPSFGHVAIKWDALARSEDANKRAKTMLHELIHRATYDMLKQYESPLRYMMSKEERDAAKTIFAIYDALAEKFPKNENGKRGLYGANSVYEMVAEMTVPEQREAMKDMPYDKNKSVTMWDKFIESIKKLLGIDTVKSMQPDALKDADKALNTLLNNFDDTRYTASRITNTAVELPKAIVKAGISSLKEEEGEDQIVRFSFGSGNAAADDATRALLIKDIKAMIDDDSLSTINKSELTRLMNQVRNAKAGDLEKAIRNARNIALPMKMKANERRIADFLALKTRDKNGKGMAIGKNVTPETAAALKMVKGRLADIAVTAYDDERRALNQENRNLMAKNRMNEERKQYTNNITDEEIARLDQEIEANNRKIEENKTEIAELKALIEQAKQDNLEESKRTVAAQKQALEEKMNKYVAGEGRWTTVDNAQWAALDILAKREAMMDIESQIEALLEQRKEATGRQKDVIDNEITGARDHFVQAQSELLNMLKDLVDTGKKGLQARKSAQIEHARAVMRGMASSIRGKEISKDHAELAKREKSSWGKSLFAKPMYSLDYMAQAADVNHLGHDGWLYKEFVMGEHGVLAAENTYLTGFRESIGMLNDKVREIYGKNLEDVMKENQKVDQNSGIYVLERVDEGTDENGVHQYTEERVQMPMSKAQATYIYMVWKMADGRAKLENQGFDEESMEQIEQFIGTANIEWADWVQSEYLQNLRDKYNQKYLEVHGTNMANIQNYVPLNILKASIDEQNDYSGDKARTNGMDKKVGALIERTHNLNPVDLTTDAFSIIVDHVNKMEEFNAFADIRRDAEILTNSRWVRNQMNANTAGSFNDFKAALGVALHVDTPETQKGVDQAITKLTKGLVAGNIAFRNTTALKQILSVPAFYGYSQDPRFLAALTKNIVGGYGRNAGAVLTNMISFGFANKKMIDSLDKGTSILLGKNIQWCMENMPSFRERVTKGMAGLEELADSFGKNKVGEWLDKYAKQGMSTNQLVDAITCSIGIKTIHDYKYARLIEQGVEPDEAHRLALMDADVYYNGTQQSNHKTFLSPMQMSRSAMDRALMVYQNASIGFARKAAIACQDLATVTKRNKLINTYAREFERQGMDAEEARKKATETVNNRQRKAAASLIMYGVLTNLLWDVGSKGLLGLFMSDDDKEDLVSIPALMSYPFRGMPGTRIISELAKGGIKNPQMLWSELESNSKDVKDFVEKFGILSPEVGIWVLNRGMRMAGVTPETWINTAYGISDMVGKGLIKHEDIDVMTDLMFLLQTPNSNRASVAKELYKDKSPEEYVRSVIYACKYIEESDATHLLPGMKTLTDKKVNEIIDEMLKGALTKEQLEELEKKDNYVKEELKRHRNSKELARKFDEEEDDYKRAEIAKELRKAWLQEDLEGVDLADRIQKRMDALNKKVKPKSEIPYGVKESLSQILYDQRITASQLRQDDIIKEAISKLKKVDNEYYKIDESNTKKMAEFEMIHGAELELYYDLDDIKDQINDLKESLKDNLSKSDEIMSNIAKLRNEAVKKIEGQRKR